MILSKAHTIDLLLEIERDEGRPKHQLSGGSKTKNTRIDEMEAEGLVRIVWVKSHNAHKVFLTAKGRRVAKALRLVMEAFEEGAPGP